MSRRRIALVLAGCFLLGVRLYLLIRFSDVGFIQGGDTHSYLKPALSWLRGDGLGHHRMYRAPGLPLLIAGLLGFESWLGDLRGAAVMAAQVAVGTLSLAMLYVFARRVLELREAWALVAVAAAGLFTQGLVYTYVLQSEVWFEALIAATALAFGLAFKEPDPRRRERLWIGGAAVLAGSLWFRPTLFLALPLLAAGFAIARRFRVAAVTAALFLGSVVPLYAGFHGQFGAWYPVVQFTGAFQTDVFWSLMAEREGPVGDAVRKGVDAIVEDRFSGRRDLVYRRYSDFTFAAFTELLEADQSLGRVQGLEQIGREARRAALAHPARALGLLAENAGRFWDSEYTFEAAFNFVDLSGGDMQAAHWTRPWRPLTDRWEPAFDVITRYVLPGPFFLAAWVLCLVAALLPGARPARAGFAVTAALVGFVWLMHASANFAIGRYRAPLEGLLVVTFVAAVPVLAAKRRED